MSAHAQENVHERIRALLEETNEAFTSSGYGNADYAEFATMALSEFKSVLQDPQMTRRQLRVLLRSGLLKYKDLAHDMNWSLFMAQHIASSANSNASMSAGE